MQLISQDGGPSCVSYFECHPFPSARSPPTHLARRYTVVDSVPSISQEGYCDTGAGMGLRIPGVECGRIEFTVPGGWEERTNCAYLAPLDAPPPRVTDSPRSSAPPPHLASLNADTIAVQSLSDYSLIGYTDDITVAGPAKANADNVVSGTKISLLSIAGPTTTNWGAAQDFNGQTPSPTAVTGGGAPTTSKDSSSSSSSNGGKSRSSANSSSPSATSTSSQPTSSSVLDSQSTSPASSSSAAMQLTSAPTSDPSSLAGESLAAQSPASTSMPSSGVGRIAGSLVGGLLGAIVVGFVLV